VIELKHYTLLFSFPEVHPNARLRIEFQRTLRIPDDDEDYPLPPGLGRFPLRHVDDFAKSVPPDWVQHGGVMLPMYQSEAMWLNFSPEYAPGHDAQYPFAVKIAAGKINAVTGDTWDNDLHKSPQDYVVVPEQPWLDGYCVEKGVIRQFVAMPLGAGYTAEEQLTGKAEHGGVQIVVYPMKRSAFEQRYPKRPRRDYLMRKCSMAPCASPAMGLAPGGRMRQEIYDDPFKFSDWEQDVRSRCYVHIVNSLVWRSIVGEDPPTVPPTAKEYTEAGLPWFEYYNDDADALAGAKTLDGLKSVATLGNEKGDVPLPENEKCDPDNIIKLRADLKKDQVREGAF